jgi:hypothetical protein
VDPASPSMTCPLSDHGSTGDPFGEQGSKLSVLLGQGGAGLSLFIGNAPAGWREGLEALSRASVRAGSPAELASALSAPSGYDLVVWQLAGGEAPPLERWLSRVRNALRPGGSLLLLAENRLALRSLARRPLRLFERGTRMAGQYRSCLRRAGFERVREFLPLPELSGPEEFVSSREGEVSLPSYRSQAEHALNRVGLFPLTHEGYLYLASGPMGGPEELLDELGRQLSSTLGAAQDLTLERFDLRDRGALVLLVRDRTTGRRFLGRITTTEQVDRVVARNAEWTTRILAAPHIPTEVKRRIPRPHGTLLLRSCTAHVEDLVEGVIAWKAAGVRRIEDELFRGVYGFLRDFNQATRLRIRLGETELEHLLGAARRPWLDDETASLLAALRRELRDRALAQERTLVWAHGDFGYGNALVDPKTGTLRGIIDWDQGREDLAGIDLLNFLVQRERAVHGRSLPAALLETGQRVIAGGLRGADTRVDYEDHVPLEPEVRLEMLGWLALRFAERGSRYPQIFQGSRDEIHAVVRWACRLLG